MSKNHLPRAFSAFARRVLTTAAAPLLVCGVAAADTYIWDPVHTGIGSDGAGVWSTSSANWSLGGSDVAWPLTTSDIASFGVGGTPGAVTVDGSVTVGGLAFETAGYSVTGGSVLLGSATPTITTNADATIVSTLASSGSPLTLTKAGAGTLTLNGSTAGISTIAVTAGVLRTQASGSAAFGSGATSLVVSSGAAIRISPGAVAPNPITFHGGSTAQAYIGGGTLSGSITLASDDVKINAGNVATISGTISGPGSLTLVGPNKLTLSGTGSSYSGGTNILDGTLQVTTTDALGTGAVNNQTNLEINPDSGATITLGNAISGAGSITKSGPGTAVLTGSVTSTGYTIVSGGTLLVNGTKAGGTSALVYVAGAGSVLGGTGTITGATSGAITLLAGGAIAPGLTDSIGTLRATSLSWTSDNVNPGMFFDLSTTSSTSDLLALTGAFSRASTTGSYIFDFQGSGAWNQTYTLISYGSTSSTSIANLVATNLPSGLTGTFSFSGNSLKFTTAVPESSQVGGAIAAFAALVVLLRRRRGIAGALLKVKAMHQPKMIRNALQVTLATALLALGMQPAGARTVTIKLETATFDDLQAAMNAGALTSVELATLYLNRRAVYDQAGVKLNVVVSLNPTLFDEAEAADELRATSGQLSPVHGLFYCTKDSYPTLGMVTSGGVRSWLSSVTGTFGTEAGVTYGPVISPEDCFIAAKLKTAGAIVLGHGNMDTWATSASSTTSNAYGTSLNAYCLGSTSGSSGGPACLTGSNFASFAWGGETGGSIRNPSDRAGVTGFKVGVGTISVNHIIPLVSERDVIGPMARYVTDAAYVMDIAATTIDPNDMWSTINYVPGRGLSQDYAVKAANTSLAGKVIGVVGTYLGQARPSPAPTPVQLTDADVEKALGVGNGHGGILNFPTTSASNTTGVNTPDAPVKAAHDRLVAELQSLGATVVTVFLPPNCDTSLALPATFADGTATPKVMGAPTTNQILAWENASMLAAFGQGIYTRLTQANQASSSLSTTVRNLAYEGTFSTFTDPIPVTHFQTKAIYNAIFEKFMDTNGLDCLIWPVSFSKSRTSNSVSGRDIINNIGMPACTVPIGVYPQLGGEPIDEAFVGRYRKESDILALAAAYQKAYNHRIPSPLTPPLDGETITYETSGTLYPERRVADKLAPVVSVKTKATVDGASVIINGVAADASGLSSLKIFVNGRKVPAKVAKKWTAKVRLADLKKRTKSKVKTFHVTVLAKDKRGNAAAVTKVVKI